MKIDEKEKKRERNGIHELKNGILDAILDYIKMSKRLADRIVKKVYEKYGDMLLEELHEMGEEYHKKTKAMLFGILYLALCIFISATDYYRFTYPIPLALISASGGVKNGEKKFAPKITVAFSFFASTVSCLFMSKYSAIYFSVCIVLFLFRSITTRGQFNESFAFRSFDSLIGAGTLGFIISAVESFTFDSFLSGLLLIISTPVFTYLFSFAFLSKDGRIIDTTTKSKSTEGLLGFLFCLIFSLGKISLFSVNIGAVATFVILMCICKKEGYIKGSLFGLVSGFALGGAFAPTLGIIGLVSGFFFDINDIVSLAISTVAAGAISLYMGGSDGFVSVMPEILFGIVISLPVLHKIKSKNEKIDCFKVSPLDKMGEGANKINELSGGLLGVSEVFYVANSSLSEHSKDEIYRNVEYAFDKVCIGCSMSGKCWSRDYSSSSEVRDSLCEKMLVDGKIEREDFPPYFLERCGKSDKIVDEINGRYSDFLGIESEDNGYIAEEYRTLSKLLFETAEKINEDMKNTSAIMKKASVALGELSIPYQKIEVCGGRNTEINVFGVYPEKLTKSSVDIVSSFEKHIGMSFFEPEFKTQNDISVMLMKRQKKITLECAKKCIVKKGETVSGDTVSFFEKSDGRFYSALFDGMGSGRNAAVTSRLASVFAEKLMTLSKDKTTTLEMLNSLLIKKKDECFTTIDIAEIDLYNSICTFFKAGAAVSFVIREDNVYKINSKTPPAGIIDTPKGDTSEIKVYAGDVILMVTDGVLNEANSDVICQKLFDYRDMSAHDIAGEIIAFASHGKAPTDDMSVSVIKVHNNKNNCGLL